MGLLEERVEAISGEFKQQEVSSSLWACATMGLKPGEMPKGLLEGQATVIRSSSSSSSARCQPRPDTDAFGCRLPFCEQFCTELVFTMQDILAALASLCAAREVLVFS